MHLLLHFSLVLVPTLGFTDAVLPPPVQDLLQLLLLSAEKQPNTSLHQTQSTCVFQSAKGRYPIRSKAFKTWLVNGRHVKRNRTYFSHVSLSFFSWVAWQSWAVSFSFWNTLEQVNERISWDKFAIQRAGTTRWWTHRRRLLVPHPHYKVLTSAVSRLPLAPLEFSFRRSTLPVAEVAKFWALGETGLCTQ